MYARRSYFLVSSQSPFLFTLTRYTMCSPVDEEGRRKEGRKQALCWEGFPSSLSFSLFSVCSLYPCLCVGQQMYLTCKQNRDKTVWNTSFKAILKLRQQHKRILWKLDCKTKNISSIATARLKATQLLLRFLNWSLSNQLLKHKSEKQCTCDVQVPTVLCNKYCMSHRNNDVTPTPTVPTRVVDISNL